MRNLNKFSASLITCAGLFLAVKEFANSHARAKAKPDSAASDSPYAALDAFIARQMRRLHIPGAALAVVEGERIVHQRGFGDGFGDTSMGRLAPSSQTPFCIGSTTKSITALAVMQLVERGQVTLDEPVQHHLPWFRVTPATATCQITVRHLLNQTGGLPLLPGWQILAAPDDRPDAAERQARALCPIAISHPPGTAFEYSNLNYNLLGLIVEAASGEPYADYLRRHIFEPLGMRHSHTSKASAQRDGMALGHQSWFGIPIPAPDLPMARGSLPSGQLICSAEDMARYLIAHLNSGRCGAAQILSPAGIAELHRPAVETRLLDNTRGWYGMGWYVAEQDRQRILMHSGLVPDFYAYMALLPEQKKGLVLLTNVDHFTMQITMSEVDAGLTCLLAGDQPAPLRLGAIPWVQRGLLLLPLLQILDVILTLRVVRRWRGDPAHCPSRESLWGRQILLPLIPHVVVALSLIPTMGRLRGFLRLFAPDFTWIARISGGFAALWIALRSGLILHAAQRKRSPSQSTWDGRFDSKK